MRTLPPLPECVNAARLPGWNMARIRRRPCPVCGANTFNFVCRRPDNLDVVQCCRCEMLFLPEMPPNAEIVRYYQSYAKFKRFTARRYSYLKRARSARSDPYIAVLQQTGGLRGLSLVEVGCSFGHFLQLAQHYGARVAGVELDQDACSHLRSLGIPVLQTLSAEKRADIICAFQLVEHLECPGQFFAEASKALVEDGRLLLAMPNGGEFEQVGSSWLGFRVDLEHLNYFSLKTLTQLLTEHGLFVEQFWLHSQPGVARGGLRVNHGRVAAVTRQLVRQILAPIISTHLFESGSFVLVVLARKTSRTAT